MNSAEANTEKRTSKKKSTFKVIKDLSKKEFTLGGFLFKRIQQDFYQCDSCKEELNFAMIPAHTKRHQKPDRKASQNSNINYTEILEYEVPKKGLVYVNTNNKKSKNKPSKIAIGGQTQNDEEYCSDNSNSEAPSSSNNQDSEPPDSENSSEKNSPSLKKEENPKQVSEETLFKNFCYSDSDSLTSDSGDSTRNWTADALDRERDVDFYKCSCSATFHSYRKFKNHCSMKKSTCERCGEISFCRAEMKNHHVICLTKDLREAKWGQKTMIPHPTYLRCVEEAVRKTYAVMKNKKNANNEEEKKEEFDLACLPKKKRAKY